MGGCPIEDLDLTEPIVVIEELEVRTCHNLVLVGLVEDQPSALSRDPVLEIGGEEILELDDVGVFEMALILHFEVLEQILHPVLPQIVDDVELPCREFLLEL